MQYGDDAEEKSATWGDWVKIKANALEVLQRSWRRVHGKKVVVGSATDPYQPIERRTRLTRSLMEFLWTTRPDRVRLMTRSPVVTRDIDVFRRFGKTFSVSVSIPTDDDEVRKVFEPSAPSIPQRLNTLAELHAAGLHTIVNIAPVLPCNPYRLGKLIRDHADQWWLDAMRYHWTDTAMDSRYRHNGWLPWREPDVDALKEEIGLAFREMGLAQAA
jgi:DNA repair photolyase